MCLLYFVPCSVHTRDSCCRGLTLSSVCRRALADTHKNLAEDIKGTPVTDIDLLESLGEEVKIADAIYEPTVER